MKSNWVSRLAVLLMIVFTVNIFAMRMNQQQQMAAKRAIMLTRKPQQAAQAINKISLAERQRQEAIEAFGDIVDTQKKSDDPEGKYFIYQKGTTDGIWVDKDKIKRSQVLQSFIEDMGDAENKFSVACPVEVLQVLFGQSELKKLSWDQLVKTIKCGDYLLVQYDEKDNKPSQVFVDSACAWINDIGNKLTDIGMRMGMASSSIEEMEKQMPDYSVFKNIKDPVLVKAIMSKLFSSKDKDNFLDHYVYEFNDLGGYDQYDSGWNRGITVSETFDKKDSIAGLLDVISGFVQRQKALRQYGERKQKEQEEEAKKWFWQRKKWF